VKIIPPEENGPEPIPPTEEWIEACDRFWETRTPKTETDFIRYRPKALYGQKDMRYLGRYFAPISVLLVPDRSEISELTAYDL
jgi:hypothetical protein